MKTPQKFILKEHRCSEFFQVFEVLVFLQKTKTSKLIYNKYFLFDSSGSQNDTCSINDWKSLKHPIYEFCSF